MSAQRRLFVVLIVYEVAVISVILAAGANIALAQGGTLAAASPLIVIGLAESLRIPLAGWSTRIALPGRLLAYVALIAIGLASAEGLSLVFEIFLDNRLTNVLHAQHRVEIAQQAVDRAAADRTRQDVDVTALTAQVTELDSEVAALAHDMPPAPAASNRTCTGKKGARVTCSADAAAVAAYHEALKGYDSRLTDLTGRRSGLQAKVDAARAGRASTAAPEALLADAKRTLDDELQQSVMHRLAASLWGVRISAVTEDQFNALKRFVILGLAGTISLLSAVASIVAHSPLRSEGQSKLARALRAMIAARRKRLRRISDQTRVEWRDRPRFVYVPTDDQGRVINPDGARR